MGRLINLTVGALPTSQPSYPWGTGVVGAFVNYDGHPTISHGTPQQDANYFDAQLAASISRSEPVLAGPHGYSGNSWPTTWAGSSVSTAVSDDYDWSFLNVKASWASVASGGFDTHCINYVNSVPAGHKHVFILNHEPENDGTQPNGDGGTFENANGPIWAQGQARIAEIVASLNRPNVYFAVCHMSITFPGNATPGSLGFNSRNPENWNPWQYMNAAAKARTILAPDGYTKMTSSSAYSTFASVFDPVFNYVSNANWGVNLIGMTEHTINNDFGASNTTVANVWKNDVRQYLRSKRNSGKLAYYLIFNVSSGLASGDNGWVDSTPEYQEFAKMAWELNTGEVIS